MSELYIAKILKELGVPASLQGYFYLKFAIQLVAKNTSLLKAVTKELYPEIAERFGTTPWRVERSIRHAVETAWLRGDVNEQRKLFGFTVDANKGRPTNSEFIGTVADWMTMNGEGERNA